MINNIYFMFRNITKLMEYTENKVLIILRSE
jgi:hypothetical protein